MAWKLRMPLDRREYKRHRDSRPLARGAEAGDYVYVVDADQTLQLLPDGSHRHPLVLGGARPAFYAGTLRIDRNGKVIELTNLSGTFRFDEPAGLRMVAEMIERIGLRVAADALVFWPPDGKHPPLGISR